MSRILLVNPSYNYPVRHEMYPSGALLLLETMAKQRGHVVKIVHMVADKLSVDDITQITNRFNADIVGITINTFQVSVAKQLVRGLKSRSKARVVIGGAHLTSVGIDEAKVEFPEADDIICGEGEHQFMSILEGRTVEKPQDLEYITPPYLSQVDLSNFVGAYPLGSTPAMFTMASRGCPNKCLPSSERVLMSDAITTKPISEIRLYDTVVSVDKDRNLVTSCVVATSQTPARSDIIKLTTKDGRILKCTVDHHVLTPTGWAEAGTLKTGDSLAVWKVQNDAKWDVKVRVSSPMATEPHDATRADSRMGKGGSQTKSTDEKSYVQSSYRREKQTVSNIKCKGERTCSPENANRQPDGQTRSTRQGQSYDEKQPCFDSTVKVKSKKGKIPSSLDRKDEEECKRKNETSQSYVGQKHEGQSECNFTLANSIRPKELPRTLVSEKNWAEQSGKADRDGTVATGIPICRRWQILDRPLPKWKMSQPRLHLGKRYEQDSPTIQFNLLAQPPKLRRYRSNARLCESWLERICDNGTNAKRRSTPNRESSGVVGWTRITSITPEPTELVYDIETVPHHNFIASGFIVHNCTFCNKSIFGNKVRYRSPENVLEELRYFARFGVKEVFIQDDTFNLNRAWYEEILQGIIAEKLNKSMRFRAPFRADEKLVDTKILGLAKKAGFWLLFYGVESGNQGMLDRMHKRLSLDEIGRAVRLTKEAGIKVETSFIVGLPGETQQTAKDTADFYRDLSPFWSGCGVAIPFPSTELYQEVKPQLDGIPFESYRPNMVYFRTDELDKDQIRDIHTKLEKMMMRDKMGNMLKHPDMFLRTVKDRVD